MAINGHSQNNEDEIIGSIFDKLNIDKGFYLEIGINLKWENIHKFKVEGNTVKLLNKGWTGIWVDSSCTYPLINNLFVTPENINDFLKKIARNFDFKNIDFFSIDIDSHDWHVVRAVLENNINIPVFCVETNNYNGTTFLDRVLRKEINNDRFKKNDAFGATTYSYYLLFKKYGYELIDTSENGINAFFVKKNISHMFKNAGDIEILYKDTNHSKADWGRKGNANFCVSAKELLNIN